MRQAAAAVSVGTYLAWEPTATLQDTDQDAAHLICTVKVISQGLGVGGSIADFQDGAQQAKNCAPTTYANIV